MKRLLIVVVAGSMVMLNGCATKEQSGQVVGGVLGGVLGSQVGGGRGRTAAIIAGTVLGGVLGGSVGKSMDETDRMKVQSAFEDNRVNQPASWKNPDTGYEYTVTPTRTYYSDSDSVCREYVSEAVISGKREKIYGTACRQPDGTWQVSK